MIKTTVEFINEKGEKEVREFKGDFMIMSMGTIEEDGVDQDLCFLGESNPISVMGVMQSMNEQVAERLVEGFVEFVKESA